MDRLKKTGIIWVPLWATVSLSFPQDVVQFQSVPHEQAIKDTYANWVETTNAKDLEAWAAFLAPGAVFFPPDSPVLADSQAILNFYRGLFADDAFTLSCRQENVEISESEDLAWSYGHCESTFTDPHGRQVRGTSKWMKVWKHQPDGQWKCAANSWSSTVPR